MGLCLYMERCNFYRGLIKLIQLHSHHPGLHGDLVGEGTERATESGYGTASVAPTFDQAHLVYETRNMGVITIRGQWITSIASNIKDDENTPPRPPDSRSRMSR